MLNPSSAILSLSLFLLATTLQARELVERASSANPDSSVGTILYVTEPACGSYKCIITWPLGSTVSVNWVNPPEGNVSISLASNIGGATYSIVDSYPAISQQGYCDSGSGVGVVNPGVECGQVKFDVPLGWTEAANYTIVVQSLSDSSLVGYTDAITLVASNSSTTSTPTGTIVSLLTIPSPTSTNLGASTQFSGTLPAPTAVNAISVTSSSASGSSSKAATSVGGSSSAAAATGGAASTGTSTAASSTTASVGAKVGAASSTVKIGAKRVAAVLGLVGVFVGIFV